MLGQMLSKSQYHSELAKMHLPDKVMATKGREKNARWKYGDNRDPADPIWWLSDQNPNLMEKSKLYARFDTAIGPNLFLDDEDLFNEALTKRIYVVQGLEFGIRDDPMGAHNMSKCCEKIDWIFRWKWSEGFKRFEFATAANYSDLWKSLKNGPLGLVPISRRLHEYLEESLSGQRQNWIRSSGDNVTVDWKEFSRELGVTSSSLRDPEFRIDLFEQVASIFPKVGKDMAETVIVEKSRKPVSSSSFEPYIGVAADLYRLSRDGYLQHDMLTLDPLAGTSVRKLARELGRARGRTYTLPPEFLLKLMDHAVVWVFEYADWIIDALAQGKKLDDVSELDRPAARKVLADSLNANRPNGAPKIWPAWHGPFKSDDPFLFPHLIKFLLLSCAILISSFGARRIHETLNIKKGCIHTVKGGVYELSIYIEKTLRDVDCIPVPAMINGVVEILESLTEPSRNFTGNDWLFEVIRKNGLGESYQRSSDIKNTFKEFAEFYALEVPDDCDSWQLASHQLRRGFAITFYYGLECRDLDALSWFLRHFDPEMTRIYIRNVLPGQMARLEKEIKQRKAQMRASLTAEEKNWLLKLEKQLRDLKDRGDVWENERQNAVVYRLLSLHNRSDEVVGLGVPRLHENINELARRAAARVRIGGRSNSQDAYMTALVSEFKKFAATNLIDPLPGKHDFCSYGLNDSDLADAACRQLESLFLSTRMGAGTAQTESGPNLLFSGLHPCLHCMYGVKFKKNVAATENKINDLRNTAVKASTPELRDGAQAVLDELLKMTEKGTLAAAGTPLW